MKFTIKLIWSIFSLIMVVFGILGLIYKVDNFNFYSSIYGIIVGLLFFIIYAYEINLGYGG